MELGTVDVIGSVDEPELTCCLVCLSSVSEEKISCREKEGAEILSDIFTVLCKWMKWKPPVKSQFNFRRERFPFCKKCSSSVVEVFKLDGALAAIQKQIDVLTLTLSARVLETEDAAKTFRPNNCYDGNQDGRDKYRKGGLESFEKVNYYRKSIHKRYFTSVRIVSDPDLNGSRRSGTISPNMDGSDVLMSYIKSESEGSFNGDDMAAETVVENIERRKSVIQKTEAEISEEASILNHSGRKRKAVQSGEMNVSLKKQGSEVYVYEREDNGSDSEYEPSIASGDSNFSDTLSNNGEVEKYENPRRNDNRPKSSQDLSYLKKRISRRHETVKSIDQTYCSKEDHRLNDVANEYNDRDPFNRYKDRITKAESGLYLFAGRSLFLCSSTTNKCVTCNLTYKTKSALMRHLRDICPGGPPTDVIKSFQSHPFFYDQLKSGEYQCRHCKHSSFNQPEMKLHVKNCHHARNFTQVKPYYAEAGPNKYVCNHKYLFEFANDQYKCGTCCEDFLTLDETVSHIHKEHTLPFYAHEAPLSYNESDTSGKYTRDGKVVFEQVDDDFQCRQCKYSSPKLSYIKDHFRRIHFEKSRFTCDECGKAFSRKNEFIRHNESHSPSVVCEICGKSFKLMKLLHVHKQYAHPETSSKQFSCNICYRSFGIPGMLTAHHVQKHELLACDVCGKEVARASMNYHMLTHSSEKNYQCQKCNKTFRHYKSLNIHCKIHDGTKPFSCDICGMKFAKKYRVIRHKNGVHNSNKAKKKRIQK